MLRYSNLTSKPSNFSYSGTIIKVQEKYPPNENGALLLKSGPEFQEDTKLEEELAIGKTDFSIDNLTLFSLFSDPTVF